MHIEGRAFIRLRLMLVKIKKTTTDTQDAQQNERIVNRELQRKATVDFHRSVS